MKVVQARCSRCANFQLKVKGQGHRTSQKPRENDAYLATAGGSRATETPFTERCSGRVRTTRWTAACMPPQGIAACFYHVRDLRVRSLQLPVNAACSGACTRATKHQNRPTTKQLKPVAVDSVCRHITEQ